MEVDLPLVTRTDGDTLIVLGPGSVDQLGSYLARVGAHRAYVVTGPSLDNGPVGLRVRQALGPMLVGTYARVRPHVPSETAAEVATEARSLNADVLIGVGGGSPIGTAKAAVAQLDGKGTGIGSPSYIVAAVPTTYAGSEVTPVFGTTDVARGRKEVIREPRIRPRLALYDPELAVYTPAELTAATGVNALAHCVEGLYSKAATAEDRVTAIAGAKLLVQHLPWSVRRPTDLVERYRLFEGSIQAGLVLAHAGMGLHHAICHVLGGRYQTSHGVLNAVVLPHAMRFNLPFAESAYLQLAGMLDVPADGADSVAAAQVCGAVADFLRRLKLPSRLRDLQIPSDDLPAVAGEVVLSRSLLNNPRPVRDAQEVLEVLRAA
ncbi:MAG: iron-containing alcohol dehydrogenase family protein, partial [Thermoplasmata archaeon]|nr:iron-containing alcohol dehydrogenase family protein [Thermoplasmata archaeon]